MRKLDTFPQLVDHIAENYDNPQALNLFDSGVWHSISSKDMTEQIYALSNGLIDIGLRPGEKVGILAPSTPRWTIADLAIIYAAGISVPLFADISDVNFVYEVGQANIRILFVEGEAQWKMYEKHRKLFDHVIGLDESPHTAETLSFDEIAAKGRAFQRRNPELLKSLGKEILPDDIATIIYTSGSTGVPKGAEITHKNLLHLTFFETFDWDPKKDTYLNILPLAHVFARQINTILLAWNISIYYLNDLHEFKNICQTIKPSLMIVVPRVLEKIYTQLAGAANSLPRLIRPLYRFALRLAADPKQYTLKQFLFRPLMDLLFYRKIRQQFGNKWRIILCGGAKLDLKLNLFFVRMGFPVYEGWGMTEGSTPVVNTNRTRKIGTVGKPLPEVRLKITEEGELLLGGPTVMKGYHRDRRATNVSIDQQGWLHTGDKAVLDKDGFLSLIGRVKEQFKLSTGEYVSPGRIEQALCQSPLIDMALVVGEAKRFASCLLFPDFTYLKKLKHQVGKEKQTNEEFLKGPEIEQLLKALIKDVNGQFNAWEKLQRPRIIPDTLSIDHQELTPTQKIRRDVVMDKYKSIINDIYS